MIHFFKKKLLILLFITLYMVPFQTQAAFSLIANTGIGSSGGGNVTTGSIDTTGANLIVVVVSDYTGGSSTLSDSKGNAWTARTTYTAGNTRQVIYYVYNPTVGSGHTFTVTTSGAYPSIAVTAWSGAATSPYDVENGSSGSGITSKQPGSVVPSENNELIITGLGFDTSNTLSINGSFTISNQLNYTAGNYMGGAMAYLVQTTAARVNPTWSWSASMGVSTGIATFKAASAARSFTLKRPPNNFLGLVARYTFDGGDMTSNVADSSGTGNNGYLSGQTSTTTRIGKIGQALSFDGSNDSLSESAIDLSGTNALSVSLWMRKVSFGAGTDKVLFEVTTNTNNNTTGLFFTAEPTLGGSSTCTSGSQPLMAIAVKGDVGYDAHCYTAPSVNEWHHYVALYDKGQAGGSETSLYIDGVLQTPTGAANSCCSNNTNNFGNDPWYIMSRAGSTLFNDGSLDDFRIYSRALSASEIKQIYNSTQSKMNASSEKVGRDGLVGYWNFDGKNMTSNVSDSSGVGNNGYLIGQTSTSTAIGKVGQALSFDGTNDVVNTNVALSNFISGSAGTMSVWMKPDTTAASNGSAYNLPGIVSDTGGFAGIHIGTVTGQGNRIWLYNWDGNEDRADITYTPGEWIHVVWVNDAGTLRAYANGVATTTTATSNTQNLTGTVRMGLSFGNTYYDGLLDEVRIYNRALSASEVKQVYLLGQTKVRP